MTRVSKRPFTMWNSSSASLLYSTASVDKQSYKWWMLTLNAATK